MLKLYGFSRVNKLAHGRTRDLRVLWALEELQEPFEIVGMDHPAHDLGSDAFSSLNPFEQIPVVVDDGVVMSESGAIVLHLARKTGRLIPADRAGAAQVERWSFAALSTVEPPLQNLLLLDWTSAGTAAKHREFVVGWSHRVLEHLERWMTGRAFVATDHFTVADLLMAHVLANVQDDALLSPYTRLAAYRDECLARPAWTRTWDAYQSRVEAA